MTTNNTTKTQTILIAAGGTGGHIFPALAIAKELEKNYHIIWLGSHDGMENTLVTEYKVHNISAVRLHGQALKKLIVAPFKIIKAVLQTRKIITQYNVKCIVVMGGFVGGLGGLGAIVCRKKLIIHEQNSIVGTSNNWLAKFSDVNFQAFDGAMKGAITCGNPINFTPQAKTTSKGGLRILVLGGSLGALSINTIIPKLTIAARITMQVGTRHFDKFKTFEDEHLRIVPFIENMAEAYANADIVIARSGAMTISELIATKSVSVLIPYPFAVHNHQTINANILGDKHCAVVIKEANLTSEVLDKALRKLTSEKILQIQENFNAFSVENPALIIKKHIDTILRS